MTKDKNITNATIDWSKGAPRSVMFGDIYFSGDGASETRHVFIDGNELPKRFETAARFSIGELGFGAGLNFLIAWDLWRTARKPAQARLDYFSVEAFPLTRDDLRAVLDQQLALAGLAYKLIAQYPPPSHGFHRIELADDVTLTLYFGEAHDALLNCEGEIDAWFLDGFSPAKNPAMWTPSIMAQAARLCSANATFATFTVAGGVRRALSDAGFAVEKRPGHGRKREMLAGRLTHPPAKRPARAPWYDTRAASTLNPGARIAVIGAGIAGASLAFALKRAGFSPTVIDRSQPASGASGNPAGIIMPRIDAGDTPDARFHINAYLYTLRLLASLSANRAEKLYTPCGVLLRAIDDHEIARQQKILARPALADGWMRKDDHGIFFPQAGVVDPPAFVAALLGETPFRRAAVTRLQKLQDGWQVAFSDGAPQNFDAVIIANGLDALKFAYARSLPLLGSAGQIDLFADATAPEHGDAFGPYAIPAPHGGMVIGATQSPIQPGAQAQTSRAATQSNIDAVSKYRSDLTNHLTPDQAAPRASIRCKTPDWMPVAGPVPDWGFYASAYDGIRHGRIHDYPAAITEPGLFILTALGSRGLVTAPLCAAMIAAEMAGAPSPVDYTVSEALHPGRFFIRALRATGGSKTPA